MTNAFVSGMVNGAIVSAVLAAAVRLALHLAPRSTLKASARYVIWWMVLVCAVVLPLVYAPMHSASAAARRASAGHAAPAPAAAFRAPASLPSIHQSTPAFRFSLPLVIAADAFPRWLPAVWAALSALFLLRLVGGLYLLARRKSGAAPAAAELTRRVEAVLTARPSRRRAAVLSSGAVAAPVLAGLRHPAILIPRHLLAGLSEPELVSVALHETAHLVRRDDYALLGERLIQALLPLDPAIWWILRQIGLEREIACDEFVVEAQGSPRRYAACLVRVMELCRGARISWAAAGMAASRSQFGRRVDALLDTGRPPARHSRRLRLLVAAAIVAACAGLALRAPRAIAFAMPPAPQSARIAPATPAAMPLPPVPVQPAARPAAVQAPPARPKPAAQNPPVSVALIVDRSGSMRNNDALVDIAVTELLKSANPADEFLLVMFNDTVDIAGTYANDAAAILRQLHRDTPRGGTSLRDAILRAAEWDGARYPRRALVVISDGDDNSSSLSPTQLRGAVLPTGIPVWAITLASPRAYPRPASRWLEALAGDSHGQQFVADDPDDVAAIARGLFSMR